MIHPHPAPAWGCSAVWWGGTDAWVMQIAVLVVQLDIDLFKQEFWLVSLHTAFSFQILRLSL